MSRLLIAWLLAIPAWAQAPDPLVAVDVGHFLAEPGAISARGRSEHEFNRELAGDIVEALIARGLRVQFIGADGHASVLRERTVAARAASLFISVHHDAVQPQFVGEWVFDGVQRKFSDRYAGFSLFVSRANRDAARSLACASAIGRALRASGFTPSLYHAEPIAGESRPFADRDNGVHYYDELVVLKTAEQPAVLLEAGVIVNRDEELALRDSARRARMAAAVAEGSAACIEGRQL